MGCDSSYMEPTDAEKNSKEVAQLLVYVIESDNQIPATWLFNASKALYGDKGKLDIMVEALCDLCSKMTVAQQDKIIYDGRNPMARKLATWWERHQKADEIRIAQEGAAVEMKRVQLAALKKLTEVEIIALEKLGLKL